MRTYLTRLAAPLAAVMLLSGCALTARRATVQELKYNPGRYHNRTVAIDGVVTSAWGTAFVPFKMYKVNDGTGEVTVIARSGFNTPSRGAHVRVRGRVNELGTFGGSAVGLHIQETDLDFKR
jgi:hypothetical protein